LFKLDLFRRRRCGHGAKSYFIGSYTATAGSAEQRFRNYRGREERIGDGGSILSSVRKCEEPGLFSDRFFPSRLPPRKGLGDRKWPREERGTRSFFC
jgi:hypothetical protein